MADNDFVKTKLGALVINEMSYARYKRMADNNELNTTEFYITYDDPNDLIKREEITELIKQNSVSEERVDALLDDYFDIVLDLENLEVVEELPEATQDSPKAVIYNDDIYLKVIE